MERSAEEPLAANPLLASKLYAPRWRAASVLRPRLTQRLDRGTESKLTLVSAPPGFGKTTVLAEWLAARAAEQQPVAWLSLDSSDNNPATFWTYVVSAMQAVQPNIGRAALAMLQAPQPPATETILGILLNEAAALSSPLVLILDDYHVIEIVAIHDGLAFLLDHLPDQLRLVIASRADPPVPLARLRARGELTEIRAADLRFSPAEAAAFLNGAMGLSLSADDVAALESRTEGWIAALQLAALSMQGRADVAGFISAFTGNDRYIVDYLVEEVLQRQPAQVRSFLLRTSILERLHAPLCDAVTAEGGSRAILETLERGNLFLVPLDDRRQWYRYHHLFADVLRSRLGEEQPGQLSTLHGRASSWFAAEGQSASAIRHAIAANDLARAAGLVESEAQMAMRHHRPDRLIEWVKAIPDELVRAMPVLSTYYGHALQGMGDMEGSKARLDDAARWLKADADQQGMIVVDDDAFASLPSRVALGRAYLCMAAGDVAGTVQHSRRALELLAEDEHHWRGAASALLGLALWFDGDLESAQALRGQGGASFEQAGDINLATISAYHDGDLLKARGRLSEARTRYERGLRLALQHGERAAQGAANLYIGMADLCCELNDLDGAARNLGHAEELGIIPPRTPYRYLLARARLLQGHGDLAGAFELLEEAERIYVRGAVPDTRPIGALKVRAQLMQGRLDEALAWVRASGLSFDDELSYPPEYQHLTLARVLIARFRRDGDTRSLAEADALLTRLRDAAETGGRGAAGIEIRMLQAFVARCAGDLAGANQQISEALTLAEPEGFARIFLDEGLPMRDLLRQAVSAGIGGDYARRLLASFAGPGEGPPTAASPVTGLAEALTARELEILRLVAGGMQNQAIADHLVISLFTVKRHIANAYGKLGVGHRTAAIVRAQELGLL